MQLLWATKITKEYLLALLDYSKIGSTYYLTETVLEYYKRIKLTQINTIFIQAFKSSPGFLSL